MLSSCWDCLLLQYHPNPELRDFRWWCGAYNKELTYSFARTPNNCPEKKQEETNLIYFPQYKSLMSLYTICMEVAEFLERPFTIFELFEHADYLNKNSLWMLLDKLVAAGLLEKLEVNSEATSGKRFLVMVYFPRVWGEIDDIIRSKITTESA